MLRFALLAHALTTPALASTLYLTEYGDTLQRMNLDTGNVQLIGSLGMGYDWGGLAWDPTTDTMYLAGGRGDPSIYTVDLTNGATRFVGTHGVPDVFSIAVDPNSGDLYALQANSYAGLYAIDKRNGAATMLGNPGVGFGGADWYRGGRIIGNMSFTSDIYEMNPANGANQLLVSFGLSLQDNGLAYDVDSDRIVLVDHSGSVWMGAVASASTTKMAINLGYLSGAAIVPDDVRPILLERTGGTCGAGPVSLRVSGATPNGRVAIAYGTTRGRFVIPAGACAGVSVPIQAPTIARVLVADAQGVVTMAPNIPIQACTANMMAFDLSACASTPPIFAN
jgi:hypothetical protein